MINQDFNGDPRKFADALYHWFGDEFMELPSDDIKKMCNKTLDILMQESDTTLRMYYGEARKHIKERGMA